MINLFGRIVIVLCLCGAYSSIVKCVMVVWLLFIVVVLISVMVAIGVLLVFLFFCVVSYFFSVLSPRIMVLFSWSVIFMMALFGLVISVYVTCSPSCILVRGLLFFFSFACSCVCGVEVFLCE